MGQTFGMIKKYIVLSQVYVAVCIVALPFVVSRGSREKAIGISEEEAEESVNQYTIGGEGMEDYITGVVAAEMPASFPVEALKAQAVASRTYAVRAVENADSELSPSDIGQAYITKEQMKANWGDDFEACYNKVHGAVVSTEREILEYEGEPILAVFHSTSAGKTETAGNIWSYDLPYLKSTDSIGDTYAPSFESVKMISEEEIIAMIGAKYPDFTAEESTLFDSIKINARSAAGYITDMTVGTKNFTGKQIREALGLRSSNFTVEKASGGIVFKTKGYGHGAGMSQYGAKYMAEQGTDYKGILEHYYNGVEIKKI